MSSVTGKAEGRTSTENICVWNKWGLWFIYEKNCHPCSLIWAFCYGYVVILFIWEQSGVCKFWLHEIPTDPRLHSSYFSCLTFYAFMQWWTSHLFHMKKNPAVKSIIYEVHNTASEQWVKCLKRKKCGCKCLVVSGVSNSWFYIRSILTSSGSRLLESIMKMPKVQNISWTIILQNIFWKNIF